MRTRWCAEQRTNSFIYTTVPQPQEAASFCGSDLCVTVWGNEWNYIDRHFISTKGNSFIRKSYAKSYLVIFSFLNLAILIFANLSAGGGGGGWTQIPSAWNNSRLPAAAARQLQRGGGGGAGGFICSMCSLHVSLLTLTIKRHIKNRTLLAGSRQTGPNVQEKTHCERWRKPLMHAHTHTHADTPIPVPLA